MSSTFGQPVYSEAPADQPQQAVNGAAASGIDQPQDLLDPNDPRLTSEALDVNTEGDAYAQPAPPPDQKWRAKLTMVKQKDSAGNDVDYVAKLAKEGGAYFSINVSASIIDPSGKYDGVKVYPRYGGGVSTQLRRDGSTQVQTLLSRLKSPSGEDYIQRGQKLTHKGWADLAVKALAGEPEAGVETIWEWSCQKCAEESKKRKESGQDPDYKNSLLGMNKLPFDSAKKAYSPEMKCPIKGDAHGYSRAFAKLARFLSLAELAGK